ncbi:MAG: hypothetical protein H8E27_01720 [Verrucomicrobia subdivision 3 bacterium]|nr:hypothetical protein [Limisphaerales bacterium]
MQLLAAIAAIPKIAAALEQISRMMTVQAASQRKQRKDDEVDQAIDALLDAELNRLRHGEAGEQRPPDRTP